MKTKLGIALTAVLIAGVAASPSFAATKKLHALPSARSEATINDAATGEGVGLASGAPTAFSGQIATGDLYADYARDNNPSNGTATNVAPKSPTVSQQLANNVNNWKE